MSAAQFQDWMKTESPTSDYCITCGAPVGPDGEFQEQAERIRELVESVLITNTNRS